MMLVSFVFIALTFLLYRIVSVEVFLIYIKLYTYGRKKDRKENY